MRKALTFLSLSLLLAACSTTVIEEEEKVLPDSPEPFSGEAPEIDYAQSYVSFLGKSNIVNHEGKFERFEVTFTPSETTPENVEEAKITATLDITSIRTDTGLEAHLQREDFFDAAKFPEATFISTSIEKTGDDRYNVTGDFTLKGEVREIVLDATITNEYMLIKYDLPRQEFGIGNDSYGNKLLDPLVPVEAKVVFK